MQNLTRAHDQLFGRTDDEHFSSLDELRTHCLNSKEQSHNHWLEAECAVPIGETDQLTVRIPEVGDTRLNDWSFSQLCQVAKVSKETVNRVSPETARKVFLDTLPKDPKPIQFQVMDNTIRSLHKASYTRLFDYDLLSIAMECAGDFQPPQEAMDGSTGLYRGEQDMFCFLIDPTGWAEINGEAFAPGFFLWNSEVGRRTVGIQTFWFQAICQNHIVWDAVEVLEFKRKHTTNVGECLNDIRRIIESLVEKRDERRDSFVNVIEKAMTERLGHTEEDVLKVLRKQGISKTMIDKALDIAKEDGRFTIFSVVDALTRVSGSIVNAGDRTEADRKASQLLAMAA